MRGRDQRRETRIQKKRGQRVMVAVPLPASCHPIKALKKEVECRPLTRELVAESQPTFTWK
jgi:hypothetical protein